MGAASNFAADLASRPYVKSPRTYLLVLLLATTLGGAFVAWRQYGELVELRAITMNRNERANLQKRVWALEKLNRELQDRLAAGRSMGNAETSRLATAEDGRTPRDPNARGGRGDPRGRGESGMQQMSALRDLMAKPEVQAMINLQQKAGIEARYATLFKNLNLSSDQSAKLTSLLAERGNTRQDVYSAAREQGIDPRTNPEAFRKLLSDAQNELNTGIKSVIGDGGFAQLQTYEQTLPQRNVVNELQQRLSYTGSPLTSAQSEQLVQILATNTPPRPTDAGNASSSQNPPGPGQERVPGFGPPGGGRGPDLGGMMMSFVGGGAIPGMTPDMLDSAVRAGSAPVTNAAIAQAQTVLAPPQVSALQQLQQQQQAQQQLQQLIRDTVMPNQPPGPRGDGGATAPTSSGTPSPNQRRPGGG